MKLRYIGNGPFIHSIPAKDFETEDQDVIRRALASKLHEEVQESLTVKVTFTDLSISAVEGVAKLADGTEITFDTPEEATKWLSEFEVSELPADEVDEPEPPKKRRKKETSAEEHLTINNSE